MFNLFHMLQTRYLLFGSYFSHLDTLPSYKKKNELKISCNLFRNFLFRQAAVFAQFQLIPLLKRGSRRDDKYLFQRQWTRTLAECEDNIMTLRYFTVWFHKIKSSTALNSTWYKDEISLISCASRYFIGKQNWRLLNLHLITQTVV